MTASKYASQQPAFRGGGFDSVVAALDTLNWFDATINTWNVADTSTTSMSESRALLTQVTPDGPVGQLFDQKGALDLIAGANDAARPQYTEGLSFDSIDDDLRANYPGYPSTVTVAGIYKGASASGIMVGDIDSAPFGFGWEEDNAGSTGTTGASFVDGISYATRGLLHDAVADGAAHKCEQRNWNPSAITAAFGFGVINSGGGMWRIEGTLIPVCILDEGQGDYAAARSAANDYADALIAYFNL